MARTRNLVTMERVAEILGEDVEWLIDIAIELEPEDGCLAVFGPGEQWFHALTAYFGGKHPAGTAESARAER
ncbi:hypothetical protein [Azospirillum sp. B510]|uniref:hypothetical protein n=1 Tax=Azospirillum sp. (strain B510) TaxID=137722 RepID=UPI0005AABE51|nr:hypothetical protein [Azospirillum sp. B510]